MDRMLQSEAARAAYTWSVFGAIAYTAMERVSSGARERVRDYVKAARSRDGGGTGDARVFCVMLVAHTTLCAYFVALVGCVVAFCMTGAGRLGTTILFRDAVTAAAVMGGAKYVKMARDVFLWWTAMRNVMGFLDAGLLPLHAAAAVAAVSAAVVYALSYTEAVRPPSLPTPKTAAVGGGAVDVEGMCVGALRVAALMGGALYALLALTLIVRGVLGM